MSTPGIVSREELYALVWAEPVKTIAASLGVSDVGLSKICRKHHIPRPPRGYWAKFAAGKPVNNIPLPRRGLGMSRSVELDRRRGWSRRCPNDPDKIEIPAPVVFREPASDLEARVRKMVGKVTVPRDLREGHHAIRRLLEQDDKRREERKMKTYVSPYDNDLFSSTFERRRLKLVNAIFQRLGRCGVRASTRGKDPEEFYFEVGEQQLSFKLDHPSVRRYGSRSGDDISRPASLPLELEIDSWKKPPELKYRWKDESGNRLERQLTDIVVTMIMVGELRYRLFERDRRESLIKRKAQLIEDAGKREEDRYRRLKEKRKEEEKAKIDRLLTEARALHDAETIRRYVASVREHAAGMGKRPPQESIDDWASYALAQADRIDPVLTGRYLSPEEELDR